MKNHNFKLAGLLLYLLVLTSHIKGTLPDVHMTFANNCTICTACTDGLPNAGMVHQNALGACGTTGYYKQTIGTGILERCALFDLPNNSYTIEAAVRFNDGLSTTIFEINDFITVYWDQFTFNVYYRMPGTQTGTVLLTSKSAPLNGNNLLCPTYYFNNQWHHIALRVQMPPVSSPLAPADQMMLYVDGQALPLVEANLPNNTPNPAIIWGFTGNTTRTLRIGASQIFSTPSNCDFDFDEVCVYDEAIPPCEIITHAQNVLSGQALDFSNSTNCTNAGYYSPPLANICAIDFPNGYNLSLPANPGDEVTVDPLLTQIRAQYPVPRYTRGPAVHRNIPITGSANHLGLDWPNNINSLETNVVELFDELYRRYNCSYELLSAGPNSQTDLQNAQNLVTRLADHASTKGYYTSIFNNWISVRQPGTTGPNLYAPGLLPDHYYQRDPLVGGMANFLNAGNGNVAACSSLAVIPNVIGENTDISTPHGSYFQDDGQVMDSYTQYHAIRLGRDIDYCVENGEVGMHLHPALEACVSCVGAIIHDATVISAFNSCNSIYTGPIVNAMQLQAWRVSETTLWNDHAELYRDPQLDHVRNFVWYNVHGEYGNSNYTLEEHIDINTPDQDFGRTYPTPFYYPGGTGHWFTDCCGRTGLINYVQSRVGELTSSSPINMDYDAPFVAPGISDGSTKPTFQIAAENVMRPANYLGVLKVMSVMGAEYFHPFEYNIPFDTVNYHHNRWSGWQYTTPAFAQAITHRAWELYQNSDLMMGDFVNYWSPNQYRFWAGVMNNYVVARKRNNTPQSEEYLISGTRQECGNDCNFYGANPSPVSIDLFNNPNQEVQFNIRRQGSTYVFDNNNPAQPLWYQLDGWHEESFPDKWTPDFLLEAELYDEILVSANLPEYGLRTEDPNSPIPGTPITNLDFRNFTTYLTYDVPQLQCVNGNGLSSKVEYDFVTRNNGQENLRVLVRARTRGAETGLVASLDNGVQSYSIGCINDLNWNWFSVDVNQAAAVYSNLLVGDHVLALLPWNTDLEIDRVILTTALTDVDIAARYAISLSPGGGCNLPSLSAWIPNGGPYCVNDLVVFEAALNPAGLCDEYIWDFGDGSTTQSGSYVNHNYAQAGNYTVTVTAYPYPGVGIVETLQIQVVGVQATITASPAATLCNGPITLEAGPAGQTYLWSTGATTQSISVATPGIYIVTVSDGTCTSLAKIEVTTTPLLVIESNGPLDFCEGDTVDLTAIPASQSYAWSTGATTQTIAASNSGVYECTVTDANNCSTSASITVTVFPLPVPVIVPPNPTFCDGGTAVLSTTLPYQSYLWSNLSTDPSITVDETGTFTVKVVDANGCEGLSTPVNVVEFPVSFVTLNSSDIICYGQLPDVTMDFAGVGPYTVTYTVNGQSHTVNTAGPSFNLGLPSFSSYVISLVSGTDNNGCPMDLGNDAIIEFNDFPPPAPVIVPSTPFICDAYDTTTLTTSQPYAAYLWSTGHNTSSIELDGDDIGDQFTVTVWEMTGCHAESAPVTLTDLPQILTLGPTSFCQGGSVVLDAGTGHYSYEWGSSDPLFSATTQTITVTTSGNYWVTVTDWNTGEPLPCSEVSDPVTVTVHALPTPVITASANPVVVCTNGDPIVLDAGPVPYSAYNWSNGATTASISVGSGGTYTVTVTDANGCTGTASLLVTAYSNCCIAPCPAPPYAAQLATDGQLNNAPCPLVAPIGTSYTADCSFPFPNNSFLPLYSVTGNSTGWHGHMIGTSEHTGITNLSSKMIIGRNFTTGNGSYLDVWRETISTQAGNTYEFSTWVSNLSTSGNVSAFFRLYDLTTGTVIATLTAPNTNPNAVWLHLCGNFEATQSSHQFAVQIRDDVRRSFAIDDISIKDAGICKTGPNAPAVTGGNTGGVSWEVWPNPTGGDFELRVATQADAQLKLKLNSTHGVTLVQMDIPVEAGSHSIPLSLEDYALGVYYLEVEMAGQHRTFKVVKQ